ncbi:MAG: hypothetical protein F9K40_22415 [Kofleriaceae bacterium]|nr:MAG: hypothetical protein F9K40_22415 [Kofleriaceae bacterium]
MSQDDFLSWPDDVQALIDDVETVEGLDLMCLVARDPAAAWRVEQLSDELAVDRYLVEDSIRRLVAKGLLDRAADGTVRPLLPPARIGTMSELTRLSEHDRANVLGAIAHFSIGRIRTSAARAFARKPPPDPDES